MKQVFHLKSRRKVKSYLAPHFRALTSRFLKHRSPGIIPENVLCEMNTSSLDSRNNDMFKKN
jgi:hypothetical protein